jgi:glycine/D-amino acid oxidase-like deaminating enzyme
MAIITIIGAGVIGGAIAYELSKDTQNKINLIDQNEPATGCTFAALGVLMGIISKKTKGRAWQLRETSIQRYQTLTTELEQLTGDKISYNNQGIVKLLFPEDNLTNWQKLSETRAKQGWKLEIWHGEILKEKLPQLELNNNQIKGAIYSAQDGQINPSELTKSLVKAAQINGVSCYFGKKVQKIEINQINSPQNREYYRIYLGDIAIETDIAIITTGLGTSLLTKLLGNPIDIRPVLGQALQLKLDLPLGNPEFQPVVTGNDVHIVPLPNNEYWVGATLEFPNSDGEIIMEEKLLEQVRQQAIAFIPQLNHATIIKTWSGKRPRPYQQSAPIINKLAGYQNIILATGHYRNGVLLAPSTALKVKEILFDNVTIT